MKKGGTRPVLPFFHIQLPNIIPEASGGSPRLESRNSP